MEQFSQEFGYRPSCLLSTSQSLRQKHIGVAQSPPQPIIRHGSVPSASQDTVLSPSTHPNLKHLVPEKILPGLL